MRSVMVQGLKGDAEPSVFIDLIGAPTKKKKLTPSQRLT
jgi:hypothetical protein